MGLHWQSLSWGTKGSFQRHTIGGLLLKRRGKRTVCEDTNRGKGWEKNITIQKPQPFYPALQKKFYILPLTFSNY
jgi:hypothetical protein